MSGTTLGDDGIVERLLPRQLAMTWPATSACSGEWKKTAERYCVPSSSLAVERRRVVEGEEELEQLAVGDHGRVERDLDHLGVAGPAGAHLLVGGIRRAPPAYPDTTRSTLPELLEDGFETPEAAAPEGGDFTYTCHGTLPE